MMHARIYQSRQILALKNQFRPQSRESNILRNHCELNVSKPKENLLIPRLENGHWAMLFSLVQSALLSIKARGDSEDEYGPKLDYKIVAICNVKYFAPDALSLDDDCILINTVDWRDQQLKLYNVPIILITYFFIPY
ncbi:hypothetical protein TrispH2_001543 [Trichoplax sp. H2]|nr:hypothetical protein TrispH2_001543 [Trichoplax sp. H2]|eukprot:RDD47051.1 hypothetical protein TrispH2_001543 [Trichoplax sp. H2]